MIKINEQADFVNSIINKALDLGLAQVNHEGSSFDGRYVTINNKKHLFLGNCSYLGLDQDDRIKEAAIKGIRDYGTFFSSSRAFVELEINEKLEYLLSSIFKSPCVVTPTTTLGHLSALPVIISDRDALILDMQVHNSVRMAATLCQGKGTAVHTLAHNDLLALEESVMELSDKHDEIWYCADGLYSMYGDGAPMKGIVSLLDKYPNLFCYIDDSHGMSWTGNHGSGYAIREGGLHAKMIHILSLSKSFGTGGAVIVFPNEKIKLAVRNAGSTLMFSGPISPGGLSAGVASAQIHLSDELTVLQSKLVSLIKHFNEKTTQSGIKLMNDEITPIRYVPIGRFDQMLPVLRSMLANGYFVDGVGFPAVPRNNAGLRFTITNHLTFRDIDEIVFNLVPLLNVIK